MTIKHVFNISGIQIGWSCHLGITGMTTRTVSLCCNRLFFLHTMLISVCYVILSFIQPGTTDKFNIDL